MKIQDLAVHTHASNATIHRFTRKLDLMATVILNHF